MCACLVGLVAAVAASPASAQITARYGDYASCCQRALVFNSDAASETIAPGCSGGSSGSITMNGGPIAIVNQVDNQPVTCGGQHGPLYVFVFGGGGDDTIKLTGVSRTAGFTSILAENDTGTSEIFVQGDSDPEYAPVSGADTLIGGPLGEHLDTLNHGDCENGPDIVRGNGGPDNIKGSNASDRLFGGRGNDVINTCEGADVVHGGGGRDSIYVYGVFSRRAVRFYGDGGADILDGAAGRDYLDGGPGADAMYGEGGKDHMFGRDGADGMFGGPANDTMYGNGGNDYMRGNGGVDKLFGGPGINNIRQ
jgi:Ca2+-binding RTX toxin-like protein